MRMGSREAESWITANDYETDETERDRQEKESAEALDGAPGPAEEKLEAHHDGPTPPVLVGDLQRITPAILPPAAPQPNSPSTKRTVAQTDLPEHDQLIATSTSIPLLSAPSSSATRSTDKQPSLVPAESDAPAAPKKPKVDLAQIQSRFAEVQRRFAQIHRDHLKANPVSGVPDLSIRQIPHGSFVSTIEKTLQEKLPPGLSIKLLPIDQQHQRALAHVMGTDFDVFDLADSLDKTLCDGRPLTIMAFDPDGTRIKAKIDSAVAGGVPISTKRDLAIRNISIGTSIETVERALQNRLPTGLIIALEPFRRDKWRTSAYLSGSAFDTVSVARLLDGTPCEGRPLVVVPCDSEGRQIEATKDGPAGPQAQSVEVATSASTDLPPHQARTFVALNLGPIEKRPIRAAFAHALNAIGSRLATIENLPTRTGPGGSQLVVTLDRPVDAVALLKQINGKMISGHPFQVVRADQAPPRPAPPMPRIPYALPPRPPLAPKALPTTSFTIRNLAKNTTFGEL